jgi:hypothetical protein
LLEADVKLRLSGLRTKKQLQDLQLCRGGQDAVLDCPQNCGQIGKPLAEQGIVDPNLNGCRFLALRGKGDQAPRAVLVADANQNAVLARAGRQVRLRLRTKQSVHIASNIQLLIDFRELFVEPLVERLANLRFVIALGNRPGDFELFVRALLGDTGDQTPSQPTIRVEAIENQAGTGGTRGFSGD